MIAMQNIIDDDKSLLTILFDRNVLKHLKCKADDYLVVFQSNFNPYYFMLAKADSGYRIRRYSIVKKVYQINVSFKFQYLSEFDLTECNYFLRRNNSIRIIIKA